MRHDEILELIARSRREEWHKMATGPLFLYGLPYGSGEQDAHGERAAYKPDLSVGLAWGIRSNDDFKEDWANKHPDPRAISQFVDVLYNGMLVYRDLRVIVDGGRCGLPIPDRGSDGRLTISSWQYGFFKLIQDLGGAWDFDEYLRSAGFEVA